MENGCVGCGDLELMEINGKPGQELQCQLQDLSSNEISCTFWGEYARQINNYISNDDNSSKQKIVIIVQYGRYKIWRDKQSVQNGYVGSKLFTNLDIAEIKEFQHKLLLDDAETKTASKMSLSNWSYNSTHDEFLNRFPIRSIEEIRDLDEAGDVDQFPRALEKLVGRKFAFKIDVAEYNIEREWYIYTMVKMTDDKHVIGELLKKVLNNEDALSMTRENKTPTTVEKDSATSPEKRKLKAIPNPDFDDSDDTPNKKLKLDLLKEIKIEMP
ncbi:hypothetical protein CTI12_AA314680 [Artemisia annua]|uniref:Nucleic acid-binding, OB-fold protein n=1 Tax=Artemisia annua TaxID=35608 RepID=A0A2U1N369_ARTAN|nr:hypothetical protein CTI12_AA314680 [Artemisia annua]